MGVDAWIYRSFSELKLPAPSSWGLFEEESKCFDQGTVLLQGGEDGAREIIPFCAPVESPGATEPTPWLPGVGILFPQGFLLLWSLLWSLGLFLLPGKLLGLPVWKLKNFLQILSLVCKIIQDSETAAFQKQGIL